MWFAKGEARPQSLPDQKADPEVGVRCSRIGPRDVTVVEFDDRSGENLSSARGPAARMEFPSGVLVECWSSKVDNQARLAGSRL